MAKSKSKKSDTSAASADVESLKSDIASFASSLGLATTAPSSGFNDSDFRKTGSMKGSKSEKQRSGAGRRKAEKRVDSRKAGNETGGEKAGALTQLTENLIAKGRNFDKFKNAPRLPLMRVSGLGVWYVFAAELEGKVIGAGRRAEGRDLGEWKAVVERKRELAERLMAQYAVEYERTEGKKGDVNMLLTTQRVGTAADKVSAFSVLLEENPVANMRSLDALIALVSSKVGKRFAFVGFDALGDLFLSLLPDRKLKSLFQQPLNHLSETKDGNSLLLLWYWEDCLKQRYERFVIALEEASKDLLPALKDKALKMMAFLLKSKPEQERRLLTALVNKLGDPQNKGASSADFHLAKLLTAHPNMKMVVIDEVDSFLFRPHLTLRAKYHAVNFLSQIRLSQRGDGPRVAKRLIDLYFALFKVMISDADVADKKGRNVPLGDKKGEKFSKESKPESSAESHVEMDSRLLSALLTGVNRAFPYVASNEADDIVEAQTPTLFQLVHSKNFNVGVQALMLLDKISSRNQVVSDRFYRALYAKLLLPAAMNTSKTELFIGLLLRAMKNDINLKRVAAFAKRLLQVALQQPPQYSCGILFLLSEVLKARPPLWNMILQAESVDEELEHFEDIVDEDDKDGNERQTGKITSADSEDKHADGQLKDSKDQDRASTDRSEQKSQSSDAALPGGYNPRNREPSFCNANRTAWWELAVLASHVHPSVAAMASTLLSGTHIVYNGNPLNDLSLSAFLIKFMEKKPKEIKWHGSTIEPARQLDMNARVIGSDILLLAETDVAPEDFVFHKFYMNKMDSTKKMRKKKKKKAKEDDEAIDDLLGMPGGEDDSDNDEIETMLDSTDAMLGKDGDYDYEDLDQVAGEDDDDLVGNVSDNEIDLPEGEDFDMEEGEGEDLDELDDDPIAVGDTEDMSDEEDEEAGAVKASGKRKRGKKSGASPFASFDDYQHLFTVADDPKKDASRKSGKRKHHKKRKST
uniref:CCAAT-binding factor domain-containing protein n=1 Tax=Kalanchoe fedtschenkoi TaxID=63787 RepID=A0A7N0TZJ5_KALFE